MIKTFITKTSADNKLAFWLKERLERENLGLDVFVWEHELKCGDEAQRMIDEVKRSIVFIPILSDASVQRDFVRNEIHTALDTETVNIFPVKIDLKDDSAVPEGIRIAFEASDRVQGLILADFSEESEWETKYEDLRNAIVNRLLELGLYYRDNAFYQDAENIDHILSRAVPTACEIKIMVDVYLRKDSFQDYFFRNLDSPNWLRYLCHYGFFAGTRNPKPVEVPEQTGYYHVPHWPALHYFLRTAREFLEHPDQGTGQMLMKIVRSVSDYRGYGERIENYHTDRAFVEIMAELPVDLLEAQDMDRIGVYLRSKWRASGLVGSEVGKSLLPKLLREQATSLAARLLSIAIDYEVHEQNDHKEFVSPMDNFWLSELMEKNEPTIRELFPLKAARIVLNKIEHIVSTSTGQFHAILIPAIEDHPQNRFPMRYQNMLVRAARDFVDSAADREAEETRSLLQDLLHKKHPIFLRIALHTISTHWSKYSDLFWPLLQSELLTNVALKHELYELLSNNHARFSEEQLDRVLRWIETRSYWTPADGFESEHDEQTYRAFQKLEWLSALKQSTHRKAVDTYERYLALAGEEPEHPGFSTWMGDVQVASISPIEVPEILQQDSREIARYLIEYRDQGEWYGEPSREGLVDAFRVAVRNEPQKFSADLAPFLQLPPYYLYYLLWGFKDAWDGKRDFDWQAVLSLCLELAETDSFWMGPSKKDLDSPGWLVSQVADLIEAGTRDDSHAFDQSLLPLAEKLLISLLEKAPSHMYEEYDLMTAVLNSPKGRVLAAAVNYSLRCARLRKDEDPSTRWAPAVKGDFTRRLGRSFDDSLEFSVTLGEYLINLHWLDKDWVAGRINEILPQDNEKHWRAAMIGYLWPGRLRRDLYKLLRDNGHYAKALETDFGEAHIRERLIQHLTIAYLWGDEELAEPESLFTRLVKLWRSDDLKEIITYLWMQRGGLEGEQQSRVLSLWRYLFGGYSVKQELEDDEASLVSDLSKLTVYLDLIDPEALEWLRFCARHFRTEQDAWFFVEYLDNLVASSPHEVGLIYLEMLENDIYPTFNRDHIVHIADTLYAEGEKELADRICNSYGSRRYDFLRGSYEQHRETDN